MFLGFGYVEDVIFCFMHICIGAIEDVIFLFHVHFYWCDGNRPLRVFMQIQFYTSSNGVGGDCHRTESTYQINVMPNGNALGVCHRTKSTLLPYV